MLTEFLEPATVSWKKIRPERADMRYQLLLSMPMAKMASAEPPLGTCGTSTVAYVPVRLKVAVET